LNKVSPVDGLTALAKPTAGIKPGVASSNSTARFTTLP